MNKRTTAGFTIIETMLFLAITAVLAAGILATSSLMVNTQRYRDSVTALMAQLQGEYEKTFNVVNGRSNDFKCVDASVSETNPNPGTPRGQSDCVIIGRYVRIESGKDITTANLVAYAPDLPGGGVSENDLEELQRYKLSAPLIAANDVSTTAPNWGATLYNGADDHSAVNFTMLIIRSPLSGTVRTFIHKGADEPDDLADIVKAENQVEEKMCIDPGTAVASAREAIVIRQYAATDSAIETLGEGNGC